MRKLLLINGPNLNLLGRREPEIYGTLTLDDIVAGATAVARKNDAELSHLQSNSESEIVERIQQTMNDGTQFLIINPGAFTHTSVAMRDALLAVSMPFIEVHLSNVYSREEFRRRSYLSDIAIAVISGAGAKGYELAVLAALDQLGRG
ncbi:MAG: type II 3-dehydroquinate dehydratase [Gammaproteobacteria bacterium]|nr:type II 3-dehydroquinate dehydratase [Gammaproteobacteria bacterium]MDD9885919.1 type II 3-dehydroquinate dehydratase [Gammaproteobacteria bacterium]